MIKHIVNSTNVFLENSTKSMITDDDLWLWIGANFYLGLMKNKNSSLQQLWNTEKGLPYLSKSKTI